MNMPISYLNLFLELQQWCFKNVAKREALTLNVEGMSSQVSYPLPVARLHGFVGHQLQQRHHFIEVINCFLKILKCGPVFQCFW